MFASTLALFFLTSPALAGDKDKDGVPNKTDQCKTEPEDLDGFEDDDGCPDPDNDGDGILDAKDKCPLKAEDKDGFEDEDGCPDPDNDGDGVLDADDKCPEESENDEVKDGCPAVDFTLLNEDGLRPAVESLSSLLGKNMNAEGCNDAAEGGQKWLAEHDNAKMQRVFKARVARADAAAQAPAVSKILATQADFWTSASLAFDHYCKDHVLWPKVRPQIDAVYAPLKAPAK